jgi:hypothetical protein
MPGGNYSILTTSPSSVSHGTARAARTYSSTWVNISLKLNFADGLFKFYGRRVDNFLFKGFNLFLVIFIKVYNYMILCIKYFILIKIFTYKTVGFSSLYVFNTSII